MCNEVEDILYNQSSPRLQQHQTNKRCDTLCSCKILFFLVLSGFVWGLEILENDWFLVKVRENLEKFRIFLEIRQWSGESQDFEVFVCNCKQFLVHPHKKTTQYGSYFRNFAVFWTHETFSFLIILIKKTLYFMIFNKITSKIWRFRKWSGKSEVFLENVLFTPAKLTSKSFNSSCYN